MMQTQTADFKVYIIIRFGVMLITSPENTYTQIHTRVQANADQQIKMCLSEKGDYRTCKSIQISILKI